MSDVNGIDSKKIFYYVFHSQIISVKHQHRLKLKVSVSEKEGNIVPSVIFSYATQKPNLSPASIFKQ